MQLQELSCEVISLLAARMFLVPGITADRGAK